MNVMYVRLLFVRRLLSPSLDRSVFFPCVCHHHENTAPERLAHEMLCGGKELTQDVTQRTTSPIFQWNINRAYSLLLAQHIQCDTIVQ